MKDSLEDLLRNAVILQSYSNSSDFTLMTNYFLWECSILGLKDK